MLRQMNSVFIDSFIDRSKLEHRVEPGQYVLLEGMKVLSVLVCVVSSFPSFFLYGGKVSVHSL